MGCNIYRKKQGEANYTLLAFDTASLHENAIAGNAVNVSCKVICRGIRAADMSATSPEQIVASGG